MSINYSIYFFYCHDDLLFSTHTHSSYDELWLSETTNRFVLVDSVSCFHHTARIFSICLHNGRTIQMNVIESAEKECAILGSLFQSIVNEMKVSIVHRTSSRNFYWTDKKKKAKSHRLDRSTQTFKCQGLHHHHRHPLHLWWLLSFSIQLELKWLLRSCLSPYANI